VCGSLDAGRLIQPSMTNWDCVAIGEGFWAYNESSERLVRLPVVDPSSFHAILSPHIYSYNIC